VFDASSARSDRTLPVILGLVAALGSLIAVLGASVPGGQLTAELLFTLIWFGAGLVWVVAVVVWRRRYRRWTPIWWLVPVAIAVGVALASTDLPLRLRFALSRSALEAVVSGGKVNGGPVDAGLYHVGYFEKTEFGYHLQVSSDFLTEWGFAYSPGGPPPGPDIDVPTYGEGQSSYRHFDGPWYLWQYRVS
jgi:hypothetical protein